MADSTINWLLAVWEKFSLWASTQPTFAEVAIGVGLFYLVAMILRAFYKFFAFIVAGFFTGRPRFRRKKSVIPAQKSKSLKPDDDAPPFIFR